MKYQFPKGFYWGSAVWATGVESASFLDGKAKTVWDEYYELDRNRFYDDVGPDDTLDFYHRYDYFASLAKDLHHNSFRTSILWARLLPDGNNVNDKAVEYYRNLFRSFKDRGIYLNVVLYWFDMPLIFEKIGGFSNRDVVSKFTYYCEKCFELFDDLVDGWFIFNEPIMDVLFKYQMGVCYPCEHDLSKALKSIYNMCVAHAMVVKEYKSKYHKKIGSVLNQSFIYPRSDSDGDLYAKHMYELFNYLSFEDALIKGEFNKELIQFCIDNNVVLDIGDSDDELIKNNTINYLGVNIYTPVRVKERLDYKGEINIGFANSSFFDHYVWENRRYNKDRGWEIYPRVTYDVLMRDRDLYPDVEIFITENGIGIHDENRYRKNGIIDDDYRIDFIKENLEYVHMAINDGVKVIGYNVWSFIDLWSPTNQFKNCYGLYEYNLDTKEVKPKSSAIWFKDVCDNNGWEE